MDWLHKLSSVNYLTNVKQDIQNIAVYFQNQVITDFQNDPNQRFTVLNYPAQQTQGVLQLDLTRLTWYGPAKQIIDSWAKEFVEIANRKPGEVVSAPTAFSINPL